MNRYCVGKNVHSLITFATSSAESIERSLDLRVYPLRYFPFCVLTFPPTPSQGDFPWPVPVNNILMLIPNSSHIDL